MRKISRFKQAAGSAALCAALIAAPALTAPAAAQTAETIRECGGVPPGPDGTAIAIGICKVEDALIVVPGKRVQDTGQPVTVIDRAQIDAVQGPDITRILQRAPSATFTRNGPAGAFTGVRVRGAEAEQLLVVIDGVRVADRASPGGGYDFGNLAPGNLARIELLRGSNSVVWGSDAIAGVLAAQSRTLEGIEASAEYGSNESLYLTGAAGIAGERGDATIYAGHARSDGFSAAASGDEADGFRSVNVGGRGRYEIAPFISAIANARYAEGTLEIDGFPAPAFTLADTDEYQKTREVSALGGLVFDNTRSRVAATFSHARTQRENFASQTAFAPSFASDGSAQRAEITAQHRFDGPVMLRAGGDVEWSRYDTGAASVAQRTLKAAYAQASWLTDALDASAGARVDDYEGFGSDVSLGADAALRLTGDLRLRASFGEGFKAPTLYQLLSEYGNETLDAERSSSVDAGLVYATPGAPLFASAGIFRRDTKNLIAFVSCFGSADPICDNRPFGTYDNVGLARAQGFEAELAWQFVPGARLGAVYGFVEAENRTPGDANEGNELARRPRHAATFSLDYAPLASAPGLSLGADLRVVSASFDDPGNSVRLEGYEVVDLRASVGIGGNLEVFGRVENATDAQYQTAAGYGTQGRAGFAGIRLRR